MNRSIVVNKIETTIRIRIGTAISLKITVETTTIITVILVIFPLSTSIYI